MAAISNSDQPARYAWVLLDSWQDADIRNYDQLLQYITDRRNAERHRRDGSAGEIPK